jgi:hypothetical protein
MRAQPVHRHRIACLRTIKDNRLSQDSALHERATHLVAHGADPPLIAWVGLINVQWIHPSSPDERVEHPRREALLVGYDQFCAALA